MKHIKIDTQGINIFFSHINLDTPLKVKNFQKRETPSNFCFSKNSYEYSNHLGNVLEVISDRKLQVQLPDSEIGDEPLGGGVVDYYVADVVAQSDYYPFGMLLLNTNIEPEKVYNEDDGVWEDVPVVQDNDYRYAFNGMEKDDEVSGGNNSYTTYYRQLDPRVGRWLSIDPKSTSWESPYVSMGNNPIMYNDVFGDSIKNGHTKERDNALESKNAIEKRIDNFSGDQKSREYKKLNREYRKAEKAFSKIDANYQMVESTISDYEEFNPKGYEALNKLTYFEGGSEVIDVYVEMTSNLYSNYFSNEYGESPIRLNGLTGYKKGIEINVYGTNICYYKLSSKKFGKNTIHVLIDTKVVGKGQTLSHEGGHIVFNVRNGKILEAWYRANPGRSVGGHGGGNPTGIAADEQEEIYKKNKKRK